MEEGKVRLAIDEIQTDSIVDGEGIRSVIWFQGCSHNCFECHNPETHDFNGGTVVSIEHVKSLIDKLEYQTGVTFSGGDPMMQIDALLELSKYIKEKGMNVWVYTGYTFEEVLEMGKVNPKYMEALKYIDRLVDGKFILKLKSFDVKFRGSSNQRIVDVAKSLKKGCAVLDPKYI